MNTVAQDIIDTIIFVEGGYSNDSMDSGGETNFGITKAVAESYGYKNKMADMPRSLAVKIYKERYWDSIKGDSLASLSEDVAKEVMDMGVNIGVNRASTILQRALNVMNNRGGLYHDVSVDGDIGGKTIAALSEYLAIRSTNVLLSVLNTLQGAFYISLAESREKDEKYVYGWFRKRVFL